MEIVKVAVIGIAGVVLAVQLKEQKSSVALYLSLAVVLFISFYCLSRLDTVLELFYKVQDLMPIPSVYLSALLKMLGITYVADFAAGICKDAGHAAIAHQINIFGKLSIFAISMPVLLALLDTVEELL